MELQQHIIKISDIDISALNFPNAIFDIKTYGFLPIKNKSHRTIAIYDLNQEKLLQILNFHWQTTINTSLVNKPTLLSLINKVQILLIEQNFSNNYYEEYIVAYVNAILIECISKGASDLHLESGELELRIRMRLNGVLVKFCSLSPHVAAQLLARIKIMASMNTAEHIFPQDGHINCILDDLTRIDARVASIPTIHGEKIVIRFHLREKPFTLETLFLDKNTLKTIQTTLLQPHGVILITGPTGSGKTTTLYSFLQFLNNQETNIIAIENPVERIMPSITQINIRPETGFDFANALRAILRLDPEIIMVGEIRDPETAKITYNAAETGHLILASLHSNDANDAINRLQSLDISEKNIISNTKLIIAQRLLRKLCDFCKIADHDCPGIFLANNCDKCYEGYNGQIPIFETLTMHQCSNKNLLEEAENLLYAGITSKQEIFRVLGHK